jgi:hypothetical protein
MLDNIPNLWVGWHVLELDMVTPVIGGVLGKWKISKARPAEVIIQAEQDTEAGLGESRMCRLGSDMIV